MYRRLTFGMLCILTVGHAVTGKSTPPPGTSPAGSTTPEPTVQPIGAPDENSCSKKNPCKEKHRDCVDGKCICSEGYGPGENDTCIKAPLLGEPCKVGRLELRCSGFGVDGNCPKSGKCECRPGYEQVKSECKPAVVKLGAACKIDGDCTLAFTECYKGKCDCTYGFKQDSKSGLCTPKVYNCINKDSALQEKGSVRLCELTVNPDTGEQGNDTCPTGYLCNTWQNSRSKSGNAVGHCCPLPAKGSKSLTSTCPVGTEHKTGKCIDTSGLPADKPLPDDIAKDQCPQASGYECVHDKFCCPKACRSSNSHFNVDGKCIDSVTLDQPCELDIQCLPGSVCTKGTCQCKKGWTRWEERCIAPGEATPAAGPKFK